jgi:hypothetical protein
MWRRAVRRTQPTQWLGERARPSRPFRLGRGLWRSVVTNGELGARGANWGDFHDPGACSVADGLVPYVVEVDGLKLAALMPKEEARLLVSAGEHLVRGRELAFAVHRRRA